jgi:hypothetical protein
MTRRYLGLVGLAALVVVATPAIAQEDATFTEVEAGDEEANKALPTVEGVTPTFVDFDSDGDVDPVDPAEPVQLSLSFTRQVNVGDVRLTDLLYYESGSVVNHTNRDVGLTAREVPGWFALDDTGSWYLDADDDTTVSVGDLRIELGGSSEAVRAGDEDVGRGLQEIQTDVRTGNRILHEDRGPSGKSWQDTFYLDLDGNGQVNPGELRIQGTGLALEDVATTRDLDAAVDQLEAADEDLRDGIQRNEEQREASEEELQADLAEEREARSTMDDRLFALGLVNLAAVAGVGLWVYRLDSGGQVDG